MYDWPTTAAAYSLWFGEFGHGVFGRLGGSVVQDIKLSTL